MRGTYTPCSGGNVYVPTAQHYVSTQTLQLRVSGDPARIQAALRHEISSQDADLPIYGVTTMKAHVFGTQSLLGPRVAASAVGLFGALGLVLTIVGLYGQVSYSIAIRWREIGVRKPLGASRAAIMQLIVGRAMALTISV